MKFPHGNKIEQPISEKFGETAKVLEDRLKTLDWRVWLKAWLIGLLVFSFTLFMLVASVNFALWLF
jgi:hypothetical protein